MTVYVTRGDLKVGDQVVVELRKGSELLTVIQCSTVRSVEPSQHHKHEDMDEVEI
jgi:hypothetical protein